MPRHVIEKHGDRWTRVENIVSNGAFRMRPLAAERPLRVRAATRATGTWRTCALTRVVAYTVDDLDTMLNLYKAGVIDWNPSGYVPSQFIPYLRDYDDYPRRPATTASTSTRST